MRLRLRDGDHAARVAALVVPVQAAMRLRLRDGDHRRQRHAAEQGSCQAAMRLRLRDGDHRDGQADHAGTDRRCNAAPSQGRRSQAAKSPITEATRLRLQCGSVSGTEITNPPLGGPAPATLRCNAAPSQGRRSRGSGPGPAGPLDLELQCGSVSGTEITAAVLAQTTRTEVITPLQCGSVSGTEITRDCSRYECRGERVLQCGSVSGTEITGGLVVRVNDGELVAAMRLRLRDGDHCPGCRWGSEGGLGCNAAPSQGRRSPAATRPTPT